MNEVIVSKPVGKSYERVQLLGIYCWQNDRKLDFKGDTLYFLPRIPFNENKDYLKSLYPEIVKDDPQGKGIFISLWKIAGEPRVVMPDAPEKKLSGHLLAAFRAWASVPNAFSDEDRKNGVQMIELEEERRFTQYKYTATQNPSGTVYYSFSDILDKRELPARN